MKIYFRPFEKTNLLEPEPAIKNLPDWYKKKSPFFTGKKEVHYPDGTGNITIKRCNPFGDALGAGYFIFLENDVQVTQEENSASFTWGRGGDQMIGTHSIQQFSTDMVPDGYVASGYKFKNFWSIKTPKGYSVLITHPLNRAELPFFTLEAIVETDTYFNPINFPFLIRKDFEGIIEAGTPIAQIIPFKRESWSKKIMPYDAQFVSSIVDKFHRTLSRYYKRFHWERKEYK